MFEKVEDRPEVASVRQGIPKGKTRVIKLPVGNNQTPYTMDDFNTPLEAKLFIKEKMRERRPPITTFYFALDDKGFFINDGEGVDPGPEYRRGKQ